MRTALIACAIVAGAILILFARQGPSTADAEIEHKQLLVYCGITMVQPMTEIAHIIEQQEGCEIFITKGGSGNLLRAIKVNRAGDLYLPGSDSYIKTCVAEGLISDSVLVGHNKAALMVRKGNPRNITSDLLNLASHDYNVVIGDPASGSIGRETKKILDKRGIFDDVATNALQLTTDSKDLVNVLKDNTADIVINWYATATWPQNEPYVDALPIDAQYAAPKKLVLGLLTYTRQPEIARKLMAYASSPAGQAIFERYGLFNIK